jgi:hypothetical protein
MSLQWGIFLSALKESAAEEIFCTTNMQGLLKRTRHIANKLANDELSASHHAITNLLAQLHLDLLPENSARQSENRRHNALMLMTT